MAPKKKRGRPRLRGPRREVVFSIRLTAKERELIAKAAGAYPPGIWARVELVEDASTVSRLVAGDRAVDRNQCTAVEHPAASRGGRVSVSTDGTIDQGHPADASVAALVQDASEVERCIVADGTVVDQHRPGEIEDPTRVGFYGTVFEFNATTVVVDSKARVVANGCAMQCH